MACIGEIWPLTFLFIFLIYSAVPILFVHLSQVAGSWGCSIQKPWKVIGWKKQPQPLVKVKCLNNITARWYNTDSEYCLIGRRVHTVCCQCCLPSQNKCCHFVQHLQELQRNNQQQQTGKLFWHPDYFFDLRKSMILKWEVSCRGGVNHWVKMALISQICSLCHNHKFYISVFWLKYIFAVYNLTQR